MKRKESKIINEAIHSFQDDESFFNVKKIREAVKLNPQFEMEDEIKTILYLYDRALEDRTKINSKQFFSSTSGWTLSYYRKNKKYCKNEKFDISLYFSLIDYDTF